MERALLVNVVFAGGQYIFYNGDVLKLKLDLADVRPTIFVSVPRLFNKFYDAIKLNFENVEGCKKSLVNKAVAAKLDNLRNNGKITHLLYDALVFNKVK